MRRLLALATVLVLLVVLVSCRSDDGKARPDAGRDAAAADRLAAVERPPDYVGDRPVAQGDLLKSDQPGAKNDLGPATGPWAQSMGGASLDEGQGIVVGPAGEAYVTGEFGGSASFGSFKTSCTGFQPGLFVTQLDAGGVFGWLAQTSCGGGSASGRSIALAPGGGLVVAGEYTGNVAAGSTALPPASTTSLLVAKLDAGGKFLWASAALAGTKSYLQPTAVAVDSTGNTYVTGYFQGQATFGNDTLTAKAPSSTAGDLFVTKLDPSGKFLWAVQASADSFVKGEALALDNAGNPHVAGTFCCKSTLGPSSIVSQGYADVLVAKLDPSGKFLWAASGGGTSVDDGRGIVVDGKGQVFVTGSFMSAATFGSQKLTGAGQTEVFVTKLDPTGSFAWATSAGGTGGNAALWGQAIAVGANGNLTITGGFMGLVTIGPSKLSGSLFGSTVYAARLDAAGTFQAAVSASSSTDASTRGEDLALDGSGNVYLTGWFENSLSSPGWMLKSAGGADAFVWKVGAL